MLFFPGSVSVFRSPLPQAEGASYLVKIVNGPDSLDLGQNPEAGKEPDHDEEGDRDYANV